MRYEDRSVTPGARYAYRLGYDDGGIESFTAETWIEVPLAAALGLEGFHPNPATEHVTVAFSLPAGGRASLETREWC